MKYRFCSFINVRGFRAFPALLGSLSNITSSSRTIYKHQELQKNQLHPIQSQLKSMTSQATDNRIELEPGKAGLVSFPGITVESTREVSKLLQRNNAEHHGFFAPQGFINHTTHALLGSYDFGATPTHLSNVYERESQTQRSRPEVDQKALADLSDEGTWGKYLGDNRHYSDFLVFFQKEMEDSGWREIINKRLFSRTGVADKFFARCISPLYHPVIHIGYGLEFGLPGLIPEGLAQAAGSSDWPVQYFLKSETEAGVTKGSSTAKTLSALLDEIHNDKKIRSSVSGKDKMAYKTLLANALDEIVSYAKQFRVPVDQIDEKMVESINISALLVGGAIRKDKQIKFDFFLVHGFTTSIFLITFISQDWITPENKARFLEWKVRFDLLWYASVGAPTLLIEEIKKYTPKIPQTGDGNPWLGIIERALRKEDDGHIIKTIRALVSGERVSARYQDIVERMDLPIVGDMWLKIAAMCIDSVEDVEEGVSSWVRGAGFDESWEKFGPRRIF